MIQMCPAYVSNGCFNHQVVLGSSWRWGTCNSTLGYNLPADTWDVEGGLQATEGSTNSEIIPVSCLFCTQRKIHKWIFVSCMVHVWFLSERKKQKYAEIPQSKVVDRGGRFWEIHTAPNIYLQKNTWGLTIFKTSSIFNWNDYDHGRYETWVKHFWFEVEDVCFLIKSRMVQWSI